LTAYLAIVTFAVSSIFLFSTKTEHHRVVTIQKPILINQERKTPAYFVYQQSRNLQQKKSEPVIAKSTFLTNLNEQPRLPEMQLTEMQLTKSDYMAYEASLYNSRGIANADDPNAYDYEKVVFNSQNDESDIAFTEQPTVLSPERKWATIQGKFELRDGVGITDHIIDIKRVEEGLVKEQGRVNLSAGTYSIDIESPNGYLIAQIHDKHGLLVGEDRQRLVNLQNRGGFFEGPFIRVGRPEDRLAANPAPAPVPAPPSDMAWASKTKPAPDLSWASKPKPAPTVAALNAAPSSASASRGLTASLFNSQKTLSIPTGEFSNVSVFSSTVAHIYDPSQVYVSVSSIRLAGEKSETPMFTKKWLENAVNLISKNSQIQIDVNSPVLIGRVLIDGNPVAGAQVQTDKMLFLKPVYLDQFLNPSSTLTETSPNGYFMFVGLDEGSYNVVAGVNDHVIGSQFFIAESGAIGFQNIYTRSIPVSQTIRCFDAFTSTPVDSDIYISSQDEIVSTSEGSSSIRTHVESNVSDFWARTADPVYASVHFFQNGRKDYVHIPMIQENWLEQIRKMRLVNLVPGSGTVIGFTPQLNFEVFLAADKYEKSNLVYFTKEGELSETPQANGGFIMFNVPAGTREIVLQNLETDKISSQVISVQDQEIAAITFGD
jgi:hypothetical protein